MLPDQSARFSRMEIVYLIISISPNFNFVPHMSEENKYCDILIKLLF